MVMTLNTVHKLTATLTTEIVADITADPDDGMGERRFNFSYNPTVLVGLNPLINQWLLDNPGFPIDPPEPMIPIDPPDPEPASYKLYKSIFISRLTDPEAETLEAILASVDSKLRLMFNSVEYFVSTDPLFFTMHEAIAFALGEPRATELLAESF